MVRTETKPTIRFGAELRADGQIALPKAAASELQGKKIVEGTIHGFPFRAPLVADTLKVSSTLQGAAGVKPGDTPMVEITRVDDEPEVRVPSDLAAALKSADRAHALFTEITPNARREWIRWVASAKQEETRQRRIEVGIDKLSKGMRRPCCFPGLNFVTKDHVGPEETWVPLPGSKK